MQTFEKDTCVDGGQFAHRDVPVAEGDCDGDDGDVDPDEEADEPADDRQTLYVLRGDATKQTVQLFKIAHVACVVFEMFVWEDLNH